MTQDKNPKSQSSTPTYDLNVVKMQKYCAYQDRCHSEVRNKLLQLKVYGDDLENIMSDLIQQDYLNEERFACSYVRGKYRMKKWGRDKILMELKKRRISAYCIKKGMAEIDEEEYLQNLESLFVKYKAQYDGQPEFVKKQKVYGALRRKGYGNDEVAGVMS